VDSLRELREDVKGLEKKDDRQRVVLHVGMYDLELPETKGERVASSEANLYFSSIIIERWHACPRRDAISYGAHQLWGLVRW
jgi:hypothetical protein